MNNRKSIYPGSASFRFLYFIITAITLCTVCMANDAQYKVDFAIVRKKVVITIENLSDTKLPMYVDSPMNYGVPSGFSIKVKNKNNQIVSVDSSRYPYGYWSPRMRESGFIKMPLKEKSIAPKSCRKIAVPLEPLLERFWVKWEDKMDDYLFLFRMIIYTEAYGNNALSFESDWIGNRTSGNQ